MIVLEKPSIIVIRNIPTSQAAACLQYYPAVLYRRPRQNLSRHLNVLNYCKPWREYKSCNRSHPEYPAHTAAYTIPLSHCTACDETVAAYFLLWAGLTVALLCHVVVTKGCWEWGL